MRPGSCHWLAAVSRRGQALRFTGFSTLRPPSETASEPPKRQIYGRNKPPTRLTDLTAFLSESLIQNQSPD